MYASSAKKSSRKASDLRLNFWIRFCVVLKVHARNFIKQKKTKKECNSQNLTKLLCKS